jgi:hypothetical protein
MGSVVFERVLQVLGERRSFVIGQFKVHGSDMALRSSLRCTILPETRSKLKERSRRLLSFQPCRELLPSSPTRALLIGTAPAPPAGALFLRLTGCQIEIRSSGYSPAARTAAASLRDGWAPASRRRAFSI